MTDKENKKYEDNAKVVFFSFVGILVLFTALLIFK